MNAELQPFVEAAAATLRDWANVESLPAEAWTEPLRLAPRTFVVALELRRAAPGTLWVALAPAVAAALAERVFAEVDRPDDPTLTADCVGEFANLIAGHAKALLQGTPGHFLLGTPRLLESLPPLRATVRLATEIGDVLIGLA